MRRSKHLLVPVLLAQSCYGSSAACEGALHHEQLLYDLSLHTPAVLIAQTQQACQNIKVAKGLSDDASLSKVSSGLA